MADDGASFIIRVEAELEKATQGLDSLQRQVQQVVTAGTERFGALEASIGGTGTAVRASAGRSSGPPTSKKKRSPRQAVAPGRV